MEIENFQKAVKRALRIASRGRSSAYMRHYEIKGLYGAPRSVFGNGVVLFVSTNL